MVILKRGIQPNKKLYRRRQDHLLQGEDKVVGYYGSDLGVEIDLTYTRSLGKVSSLAYQVP